ncbi:toprim domain-containing protein [Castellaniella sp.]|uniref:toprim domain-containing protein n=1 Tax=Castellaniella sp. TaxID=1955812 RepID=UPI002AFEA9C0|nr:toprim domain-containing protein [Castellaniella sp.]
MAANLFVIEAPGKRQALAQALRAAGVRDVLVLATIGHIGMNPQGFKPLAIDSEYRELAYRLKPDRERIAREIEDAARAAKHIYLASDDDQEGDVIARDVMRWCIPEEDKGKVLRVRLKSLAPSEVRAALAGAAPFEDASAARGDARRIVDRLIGSLSSDEGAVGRVQGSLLLELQSKTPVAGVMTYVAPAADGRGDWTAQLPVFAGAAVPDEIQAIAPLAVGASRQGTLANHVMAHDEILLSASLATERSLAEVSSALQGLYERGQMTYPRGKHCAVTPEAVRRITAIARASGAGFVPGLFTAVREPGGEHSHEAPNPMVIGLSLNRDLGLLPLDEQILVHVARRLIECGVPCEVQAPDPQQLRGLPAAAQGLAWRRRDAKGAVLWREPIKAGYRAWTSEQSLLHFMSKNDLGRPSTIVAHVSKFLNRDLVTQDFDLTKKGRDWSAHVGRLFGHQNLSKIIENYIEEHKKAPSLMVADMIEMCGLNNIPTDQQQDYEYEDFEISTGNFP